MDDLEKRFSEGDSAAFEELFRARQYEVYRWVLRLVRDPAAAEDITIETFWRAYRAARRFDPERSLGAWLRAIATNLARTHVGRQRPEVAVEDLARYGPPVSVVTDWSGENRRAIIQAFQKLPEKLRSVALLALVEEVSYAEIGAAMGISVGAVKTRVFRAVRQLRNELEKRGIRP
jgi:RNA polymerase sigma-70 factor (ECF subfamily)